MAKPLARVLALLGILQTGGTRTLRELSDRLGVNERTVRRYVGHLLDLDVPVESVRGRYGGYRLAPGYRMPPLMLTDDEALAVLLGLVGTRRAALQPDTAVAVESATAKVQRVLPRGVAGRLDALVAATCTQTRVTARRPPRRECCSPSPRPLSGVGRSPSPTATRRTGLPNGCSSRTALSHLGGGGTPPDSTRAAARCAPSGWTASRTRSFRRGSSRCRAGSTRRRRWWRQSRGRRTGTRSRCESKAASGWCGCGCPDRSPSSSRSTGNPGGCGCDGELSGSTGSRRVLAGLGCPFVIEEPDELRERVRALAEQLTSWAEAR